MSICEKCKQEHDGSFASGRFCSRSCSNKQTHSQETKNKISNSVKNSEIFKIKNKERNHHHLIEKTKGICPICKNEFYSYPSQKRIFCSTKCFVFDQRNGYIFSKLGNKGGYQPGSGRGKSGWYKGIFCNSTYELAWVIYNIEHDISFRRNNQGFIYTYEGKKFKYYPDFIQNDEYIEIKGFLRPSDKFKFEQFPGKLKILYEKDIKEQINYCKQKYGYHFEELYEGNPHNTKLNKCIICGNPAHNKCCSQKCCGLLAVKNKHLTTSDGIPYRFKSKMAPLPGIEPGSSQ